MSKRFGTLFNSPLFKESIGNDEEDFKEEDEVGAEADEATDDEFDANEIAGEDLSYLDGIDDEEDETEEDDSEGDDEDFDESEDDYEDDGDEEFDDESDFEEGEDEDFSEEDEEFGDDEFEGESEGTEVGGEAPQLTSNTYDSGKAEEEPKMFYPSEEEVTLEVIEETGNGAVGDEPALTAMEMETPEANSVEVGESQTELPEIPEEYDFEGTYNDEDEFDFDNGFGANLEVSEEGAEDDFDGEGDDFGTDEDEEFDSEEGDDEDFDDMDDEEFETEEESDDDFVEADGVDFGDDDFDAEEGDDEDFDIDTDGDDEFETEEEDEE